MRLLKAMDAPAAAEESKTPSKPGMLARLGLTEKALDSRVLIFEGARFGKKAPKSSEDLERILALPRRPVPTEEEQEQMAAAMTERLRRDNPKCRCRELRPHARVPCITRLLPVQGWYLTEASQVGGAVGHVLAGGGKTGIDILLGMVAPWTAEELKTGKARMLLLIPPSLRSQFMDDYVLWSQHFNVPNLAGGPGPHIPGRPTLDVLAYSELSHKSCATWLAANKPKRIVADECQNLKDKNSTRTSRFIEHFISSEDTELYCHSGTLTTKSPDDYGHLCALALREGSPVPLESAVLGEWCDVLTPANGIAAPIGALRRLCDVGESARSGYRRRLVETKGVIITADARLDTHLVIKKRDPGQLPENLKEAIAFTRDRKKRPDFMAPGSPLAYGDGEELNDFMQVAAVAQQLACGFFYRWKYPRGEPEELILRWLKRRAAYAKEVRDKMEGHRGVFLDSPGLLKEAALRALEGYKGELPVWHSEHLRPWLEVEDQVQPEQDTVWLSDFLARDAVKWGNEAPGVIWYGFTAFGKKVAELGGFPLYEGGDAASEAIKQESGKRTIVASIDAHGTGKNLQMFSRGLVSTPPDVGAYEQLLARHHRQGQEASVVEFQVYLHTLEVKASFEKAEEAALGCQETTGKVERLLYAEKLLT